MINQTTSCLQFMIDGEHRDEGQSLANYVERESLPSSIAPLLNMRLCLSSSKQASKNAKTHFLLIVLTNAISACFSK